MRINLMIALICIVVISCLSCKQEFRKYDIFLEKEHRFPVRSEEGDVYSIMLDYNIDFYSNDSKGDIEIKVLDSLKHELSCDTISVHELSNYEKNDRTIFNENFVKVERIGEFTGQV